MHHSSHNLAGHCYAHQGHHAEVIAERELFGGIERVNEHCHVLQWIIDTRCTRYCHGCQVRQVQIRLQLRDYFQILLSNNSQSFIPVI